MLYNWASFYFCESISSLNKKKEILFFNLFEVMKTVAIAKIWMKFN